MEQSQRLLIAVDGPAASGKGTIARALARHYDLPHLDTGMLYRGVALALFRFGGDPGNAFEARRAVEGLEQIDLGDEELRSEVIGEIASRVSAYPGVREALLERQKHFADQEGGAVLDGRDIGTVICPDADAKLFVTASPEVRAERRFREIEGRGIKVSLEDVLADIRARDERDAGRDNAPLVQAEDAVLLDTSAMGVEDAIAAAVRAVETARGNT
ncbi:(d)CMP kinase [Sphingomicrobium arenosum]|uniref:(d)CMP kinase n=1 Tax=Sphingomicrobium arenosum TaxID=2233861 RepID=UPI00223F019C|nr:(d)CMP kinase [Sphingomicrobium arenosum]